MARKQVSRTPRQVQEEYIPESIFDSLGPQPNQREPQTRQSAKKKDGPTVEELLGKLNAMQEQLDAEQRARAQSSSMRTNVSAPIQVGTAPELSLENLPDPVTDSKAYAAELIKRGREHDRAMQNWEEQRKQAASPQPMGDPDALWQDFSDAYPAYVEDEDLINVATVKAAKRLTQRGVDITKYMYANSDLFFKDIVREYEKTFGKPKDDNDDIDGREQLERPAPQRATSRASDVDDGDDGRTEGILGGAESGGIRPQGKPKPGDFIKDLQDMQRGSGYF